MHSIYLGIQAFINAAGGSTSLSSKDVCSLTEFISWLPAPLLSTLWHPLALGSILLCQEPRRGAKGRELKSHVFLGSMVSQLMRIMSFLCSPVHEALCLPTSVPCLGDVGGDQDLPPQRFFGGHTVSKWWSQDESRATPGTSPST